jgi:pimeloyl-ACP methyl ester carboxylesterase
VDPKTLQPPTPDEVRLRVSNQRVLNVYAGEPFMHDPGLPGRLASMAVPAQVLWGAQDRIVRPAYEEAYARMIPGAVFALLPDSGHLPQLEQPEAVAQVLRGCALRFLGA